MPHATPRHRDRLRRLTLARQTLEAAQVAVDDEVAAARADRASWAEIGDALGVSRQAAFKRFASPRDPRTGRAMKGSSATDLLALTVKVFELLDHGDVDALVGLMTPEAAVVLTPELLLDTWAKVVADTGRLVQVRPGGVDLPDGTRLPAPMDGDAPSRVLGSAVGHVELRCEAGEWLGRVAVDLDGRVAGILVLPPGTTDPPF